MSRYRTSIALLSLLCLFLMAAAPAKLPDPPAGYTWFTADLAKLSLLVPDGWHKLQEGQGETAAAFVTKEPIKDGQMFTTGLSVNIIRGRKEIDAPAYAQGMIEQMQKKGESRGSKKITRQGLDG